MPSEENKRYAYSKLTDTWYVVHDWEHVEGDKIIANGKEEVDRDEVPQEWIDATDETPYSEESEESA